MVCKKGFERLKKYQKYCDNTSRTTLYECNIIKLHSSSFLSFPLPSQKLCDCLALLQTLHSTEGVISLLLSMYLNFCLTSEQQTSVTPAKVCTRIHSPTKPRLSAIKVIKSYSVAGRWILRGGKLKVFCLYKCCKDCNKFPDGTAVQQKRTSKAGRLHTVTQTAGFIHRLDKLCRRLHQLQSAIHSRAVFTDDQIIARRTLWKAHGRLVEGQRW